MDYALLATEIAAVIGRESMGTHVVAWSDGSLTHSLSCANPVVSPGAVFPVAFFVAGLDRPDVEAINLRLLRAFSPIRAA